MADESPVVLRWVALLVVAPIAAAVVISALLLFGVEPHLVFLPGHFVNARIESLGLPVAKPVGVLVTEFFWWVIVVSIWLVLRRSLRKTNGGSS
jgi:hypothetical protein